MKRLLLLSVLSLGSVSGFGAPEVPLTNAAAREVLSLNGRWHVIVDPYDNGYVNYRLERFDAAAKPTGGYFLDQEPARGHVSTIDMSGMKRPSGWESSADGARLSWAPVSPLRDVED